MLSVTVGTSRSTYEHDGRSGDINLMLWPTTLTLAYVGYDVVVAPASQRGGVEVLGCATPSQQRSRSG